MLRNVLVAGVAASLLVGCGQKANDIRLSLALNELRQECFGNDTYTCRNKTIDFNIMVLKLTDFKNDSAKEGITKLFGDKGWSLYKDVADDFVGEGVDMLDDMRPNIFARWFLGDSMPPSPKGRVMDFNPEDMAMAERDLQRKFSARAKKEGLKPNEEALRSYAAAVAGKGSGVDTVPPQAAPTEVVTSPVRAPEAKQSATSGGDLASAITAYIDALDKDGGTEYAEGRQVVQIDLNGDGDLDAVVLFTIEGAGGAQNGYQTLAAFYHENGAWKAQPGPLAVEGSVRKLTAAGINTVLVDALTAGPDDPDCCPSVETPQRYQWTGEKFIDLRDKPNI